MINEERLQVIEEKINKYANSRDILILSYDNVCDIIKDIQKNNKKLFINAFGDDITLEEAVIVKDMYTKALKDLNKFKGTKNKYCSLETISSEHFNRRGN